MLGPKIYQNLDFGEYAAKMIKVHDSQEQERAGVRNQNTDGIQVQIQIQIPTTRLNQTQMITIMVTSVPRRPWDKRRIRMLNGNGNAF